MPRESWEEAHDYYYDTLEAEDYEGLDDIEEWKKEEQKIIDELRERIYRQYGGKGRVPDEF
jgi:hypothetical protein